MSSSASGVEGLYKNFGILADSEDAGIEKVSHTDYLGPCRNTDADAWIAQA